MSVKAPYKKGRAPRKAADWSLGVEEFVLAEINEANKQGGNNM
jgi:hypothetical protein